MCCREYETFVETHPKGNIMQSLCWPRVKRNWQYEALIYRQGSQIVGTMLILMRRVPILDQTLLYAPHGPVCDYTDMKALRGLMAGARDLARQVNAYLFRIDPCIAANDQAAVNRFLNLGLTHIDNPPEFSTIQPRNNYMLDIAGKTEEELLGSFHPKWRYNIRLAQRRGVTCTACGAERLDDFYRLLVETGKRDGFPIRSKEYFAHMLDGLGSHARLFICDYQGKPVSAALATHYAGVTCYLYGASSNEYRNVMPNYLMQWTMIRSALARGDHIYDFQGIPCYDQPDSPHYGVYRFKKGFNGHVVTYAGEFDLCLHPVTKTVVDRLYHGYNGLRRLKDGCGWR